MDAVAEAVALGEYAPWRRGDVNSRVFKMRRGAMRTPPWFVDMCCRVIGKSVAEVMGASDPEWVRRFGADGRGGQETTPARPSRRQRGWSRKSSKNYASEMAADMAAIEGGAGERHDGGTYHAA